MPLPLHPAAHQPECHEGFAVLLHEGGDDRVERTLAGRISVGVRRIEAEELAPVLEHEAQPVGDAPAAHAAIVRLERLTIMPSLSATLK